MSKLILTSLWLAFPFTFPIESANGQAYSRTELPPLLEFLDGRKVRTPEDWKQRRAEIRSLLIQYFIGSFPAETPQIAGAEIVSDEACAGRFPPEAHSRHVGYSQSGVV